ncbi:MAG: crotonase/enoyl-CoA hydratase family protein [Hyphomicrobiaceae bacterium]
MSELVGIEDRGPIRWLRLNRADKKNAITSPMYRAMTAALDEAEAGTATAAVVIAGQPGVFSAGNDIGEFLGYAQSGALGPAVLSFLKRLVTLEKPLVAAVDGLAIGVGTTLLFHCDLVYASPGSTFRTPFLDLGLVPEAGSSLIAPRLMGHQRAFEMLCLGASFTAEKALAAGLVNEIVPADRLEARVGEVAARLASRPPDALKAARRLVRGDAAAILAQMDKEADEFSRRLVSAEAREAFAAFLEKRPADFAKLHG